MHAKGKSSFEGEVGVCINDNIFLIGGEGCNSCNLTTAFINE